MGENGGLSDYEQQRLENIARNEAMLEQLGLSNKQSNLAPPKQPSKRTPSSVGRQSVDVPSRRCARLSSVPAGLMALPNDYDSDDDDKQAFASMAGLG